MNTIPRLVGDKLNDASKVNKTDGQVLLIVSNPESLDNNREIKKVFPHEIPAWIKNIVISDRKPQGTDMYAGNLDADTGYPTDGTSTSANNDPFPLGTVWLYRLPANASSYAGIPDPNSGEDDPSYEAYMLADSGAINPNETSAASWVRIALESETANHKSSSVRQIDIAKLEDFGKDIASGKEEMFAYVPSATVTFTNQQETVATKQDLPATSWFVKNYRYGGMYQQTAIMLNNPYYQIHRSQPENGIATDWKTIDMRSNTPVGAIVMWLGDNIPEGWLLCENVTYYDPQEYPELFAVIGYKYGQEGNKFRLPSFSGRVPQGHTSSDINSLYKSAGLPNITGTLLSIDKYQEGGKLPVKHGAFTIFERWDTYIAGGGSDDRTRWGTNIAFSANSSNEIYGNSTTVQPPACLVNFIIKYK